MDETYTVQEVADLLTALEATIMAGAAEIKLDSLTGCVASASRKRAASIVADTRKELLKNGKS